MRIETENNLKTKINMDKFEHCVEILYEIDGLKAALSVAAELFSETGMSPVNFVTDEFRVYNFDYYDALAVSRDVMPLKEYERRHLIGTDRVKERPVLSDSEESD